LRKNIKEINMTDLCTHPTIFIPPTDYDRLLAMAEGTARRQPDVAEFLMRELDRASTRVPGLGDDIVRMQSHVRFRNEATGRIRDIQLVYPEQVDPAANRISILTPVGAALIGLSEGQTMRWRDRNGESRSLTVLEVHNAPETVA
jgi:regulator of nucleoside diphosphate kinase